MNNATQPHLHPQQPRPNPPMRYLDLLDQIRNEYDAVITENKGLKGIRDEYHRKLDLHFHELTNMENALLELEKKHHHIREHYESELMRLNTSRNPDDPKRFDPATVSAPPPAYSPSSHLQPARPGEPHTPAQTQQHQSAQPIKFPRIDGQSSMQHPAPLPSPGAIGSPASNIPGIMSAPPKIHPMRPVMSKVPGQDDMVHHTTQFKKDAMPGPPGVPQNRGIAPINAQSALPGSGRTFRPMTDFNHPSNPQKPVPLPQPAPGQPQAHANAPPSGVMAQANPQPLVDDDWNVTTGRSTNGAPVNMQVSLQNTLTHNSVVCCVRYSWDGQYLATGSNRSAQVFDANTGQSVAAFAKDVSPDVTESTKNDSYVRAVCFSPDGNWLITGAEDHVVKVWDVRNRTVKHRLVGHDTDIYSVDTSANSQFIISGSGDKKAKLWNLETGKHLTTLGGEFGPTDGITSVSVSPTSQHVAAGSLDKIVRVWDVESARLVRQFEGHRDSVYSVAFAPDGRNLLSGSLDKTLKLWDLAASQPSSQCRLSFSGHKDFVLSVTFSPDGRWLMSGSKDRTVQFWDPRQSTTCVTLQGHKNSVISIAHNPTNKSIGTGSGDCRARTWRYT